MTDLESFSFDQLAQMPAEDLEGILRKSWNLEVPSELEVIGNIQKQKTHDDGRAMFIENMKHPVTLRPLNYPIIGWVKQRVYVPVTEVDKFESDEIESCYFRASVTFSPDKQRELNKNPFALSVRPGTLRVVDRIPVDSSSVFSKDEDDSSLYIERTIIKHLADKNKKEIVAEYEAAEKALAQLKVESELERNELSERLKLKAEELDAASVKQNKTAEMLHELNLQVESSKLKLNNLEEVYAERVESMNEHLSTMKSLIEEKGSKLVRLNLLDKEDLNVMLGNKSRDKIQSYGFSEEFNNNFHKGVSYIQAYLLNRDIYYSQSVIRNFWALLRTNDLIILAGDSGSGKTNLVKSFANAIGGVAKIIPVKPNWTSSEDLLGYYNPIEKKYLSTEFLDALREASQNPEVPYLICLDEMNLARVEYYFADFLSKLEERSEAPEIHLYSSSELSDTLKDYRTFLNLVEEVQSAQPEKELEDFISILKDDVANETLHKFCGFHEGDSLLRYHSYIRKQARGVIHTPTSFTLPANVRVIGAINIDETTHYLSPKILDRAHVVKFQSPLLHNWDWIESEVQEFPGMELDKPLGLSVEDLGLREEYPAFDHTDPLVAVLTELATEYFLKLGLDFGLRTIRQALHYRTHLTLLNEGDDAVLNNLILQKVLPKMTFDGNRQVDDKTKIDLLYELKALVEEKLTGLSAEGETLSSVGELAKLISDAKVNDGNVNYWSR